MSKENDERIKRNNSIIVTTDLTLSNKDNTKNKFFVKRDISKNNLNSKEKITRYTMKKKNNIFKNKIQLQKYVIAIELLTMGNIILSILSSNNIFWTKLKFSNITIKVKGTGEKNILSTYPTYFPSDHFPNEVYINNIKEDSVKNKYTLTEENNKIKLVWYNKVSYICCIFCGCPDIYDIDFSDFDTSDLTNISWMFWPNTPKLLTSLDLSNFYTLKVKNMEHMFDSCNNLEYIMHK